MDKIKTQASNNKEKIEIVSYKPAYKTKFAELNIEWIEQYWEMEESDYITLNDPEGYVINAGGYIFFALLNDEVVGTCALIHHGDSIYELAKMAVTEKAKRKGIGFLLGQSIIKKAKTLNPKALYLESNTMLKPAINLYTKLGFVESSCESSPYERCNIRMRLK